jgi:hypothetical protein
MVALSSCGPFWQRRQALLSFTAYGSINMWCEHCTMLMTSNYSYALIPFGTQATCCIASVAFVLMQARNAAVTTMLLRTVMEVLSCPGADAKITRDLDMLAGNVTGWIAHTLGMFWVCLPLTGRSSSSMTRISDCLISRPATTGHASYRAGACKEA